MGFPFGFSIQPSLPSGITYKRLWIYTHDALWKGNGWTSLRWSRSALRSTLKRLSGFSLFSRLQEFFEFNGSLVYIWTGVSHGLSFCPCSKKTSCKCFSQHRGNERKGEGVFLVSFDAALTCQTPRSIRALHELSAGVKHRWQHILVRSLWACLVPGIIPGIL